MDTVYTVRLHDGEQSWIGGVFTTRERAESAIPYFVAKYGDFVSVDVFAYMLDTVPAVRTTDR